MKIYMPVTVWFFIVTLTTCTATTFPENSTVDQIRSSLSYMSTWITMDIDQVNYMEVDLYTGFGILFSDEHALKTSDGINTSIVVGQTTQAGYKEGKGTDARFKYLTGFTQVNSTTVIAVDIANHCLRSVDRITRVTAPFSGNCTTSGYQDGDNALYSYPRSVLLHDSKLHVADQGNSAIRVLDLQNGSVSTLCKDSRLNDPQYMVLDSDSQFFYVTIRHGLVRVNKSSSFLTVLTSTQEGFKDGALNTAEFDGPQGLAWLSTTVLAVADLGNHRVRLVDFNTRLVSSICTAPPGIVWGRKQEDGPLSTCQLILPKSVLLVNSTLYVGENKAIRVTSDFPLPTDKNNVSNSGGTIVGGVVGSLAIIATILVII